MESELPDEFDLIVVGTGFSESCVAAAASRIGKTVLHIDPNEFYGGCWASFNLESFQEYLEDCKSKKNGNSQIGNVSYKWHSNVESETGIDDSLIENSGESITEAGQDDGKWSRSKVSSHSRRFNIDLSPKILFSAGTLVELLISSNICRYAEFRAVDKLCTNYQNEIVNVPCSRTDVFNTKDLSIVEKRLLMKVLTSCVSYGVEGNTENFSEYSGKLFIDYLKANHLTEKIIHCVLHAIAMCNESTSFEEGIERTKKFLLSLGRYGNTPFLFPMYGCGEIPQCFCRLCAVFGGIYCLKKRFDKIEFLEEKGTVTMVIEGKTISTKSIVLSQAVVPLINLETIRYSNMGQYGSKLARGVFITSSPIGNDDLNSGGGGVNLLRLISEERDSYVIQLSHYSGTCPKGLYLIHMTAKAISEDPHDDLAEFYKQIFPESSDCNGLLFSAYFTITPNNMAERSQEESKIYCSAGPFFELDYDLSIKNALDIFSKIYPNMDFLPRAPDPEEIIIGDEDPVELSTNQLAEDLQEQFKELEKDVTEMEITEK